MEKKMLIEGMKCMHCKANVEKALKGVAGVTDAEVDLEAKTARIIKTMNITPPRRGRCRPQSIPRQSNCVP